MINKEFNLDKFKKQSAKVSGFLNEKGHTIPKSTIMHALSIFLEEKNWNTLSAKFEEEKKNEALEEKKWNTLSDKFPEKKPTEIIVVKSNTKTEMLSMFKDECVLILRHIYDQIFSSHFPVKVKSWMNEINLKNIVDAILCSDGVYPPPLMTLPTSLQTDIFPDAEFLIQDMNLIGDEQILKITFSYNNKMSNCFLGDSSFSLFNFLRGAIYLMTKPDAITGSDLGKNILGTTRHVCLESANRSKAYFFIPLSMKEDFVKRFTGHFGSASSMKNISTQEHLDIGHIKNPEKDFADKLLLSGIEEIQFTSCFLNDPDINNFLSTR